MVQAYRKIYQPSVQIQEYTTKNPISMIGMEAGVCWGANIGDTEKNFKRGLDCLNSEHGRTFEFPDVYLVLDDCSARVIREWYTHIGGSPTRLQASTRYIDYQKGFDYVVPPSISSLPKAEDCYDEIMAGIRKGMQELLAMGVPREDVALCLPLGMTTKIVCKHNLRNLLDMSRQRMCTRAYHEYRRLYQAILEALSEYSEEWKYLVEHRYFSPKCIQQGGCKEKNSCGFMPRIYREN